MKIFYSVVLTFIALTSYAQKSDNRIVIGKVDTIYSNLLKEKRAIFIHVPEGSKDQRYPVLYLLDAENHFNSAAAILDQLSGPLPEMIIVGIANTVRERDLTPTKTKPSRIVNAGDANISGGGENFISFIQTELMPYIESKYPTAPYKVFSGHSLGGLTVINAFINHTNLFNACIAIDPSLWWDDQKLLKQAQQVLPTKKLDGKSLFVAIANNMPVGMDTIAVLKDTSLNTTVTRSVLPFVQYIKDADHNNGLRFSYKFYPNERHGTVELNAEYDALRSIFAFYQLRTSTFDGHPEMNVDSVVTAHYKKVSAIMGYKVAPSEDMINSLAYGAMGAHNLKQAYHLFITNTENYPNSVNAFDSLGDYYVEVKDNAKAIAAFTKSLSLKEDAETRQKLEALREKK